MRTDELGYVVEQIAADLGFSPEFVGETYLAALAELSRMPASTHTFRCSLRSAPSLGLNMPVPSTRLKATLFIRALSWPRSVPTVR